MSQTRKVAKEASISFIGLGFGQFVRYLFTALLGRFVGVEYLGVYSLGNALTRIMETLGRAGLDTGVLRFGGLRLGQVAPEEARGEIASALKMGISLSLLAMLVQLLAARWLAVQVFHADMLLRTLLVLNALSLPFMIFTAVGGSATQVFKRLKFKIAAQEMIIPAIMLVTLGLAVLFARPEWGVLLPALLASLAGTLVMMIWLHGLTGLGIRDLWHSPWNPALLKYSLPLLFSSLITIIMHWTDIIMLGAFLDEATVGLYHPAARTAGMLRVVLVSFMNIYAPMLAEMSARDDRLGMGRLYKLVTRWVISLTLPVSALILLFPQRIMLLFGPDFMPGAPILMLLTAATLIQSFLGTGGPLLTMTGHPRWHLLNAGISLTINIILNIILIPRYGAAGAAMATLISLFMIGVLRVGEVWFLMHIQPFTWVLLKPILAVLISVGVTILLRGVLDGFHTILTLAMAGSLILGVHLLVLRLLGLDEDDREFLAFLTRRAV